MIAEMPASVSFTLKTDAIKCNNTEWDLTHRFMVTVGEVLADPAFKPKGGAALVTMIMDPKAKDLTVAVNPDGKHFTLTCPTSEPAAWDQKIKVGMRRGSK